ncbi:MAG: helix-turn-helix domain-containing protein [Ruminiclostridium sp.]|nr:helix-turn-helix domain-containing protein [Ruminiclostridium sp.]
MTTSVHDSCTDITRPDTDRITDLLRSGSPSECRAVLDDVLDGMHFREMKSLMLRLYACVDIYIAAKNFSADIGISDKQFAERLGTVDELEPKLSTSEEMIEFLYETLMQCIRWRGRSAKENGGSTMKAALDYIERHYMNCDISLSSVADDVGLSPSYLSMLFKKETGLNFSEHLTRHRIAKAKELLCCTSKMVYEVAYDVGFSDYRYFSQIFKKYTGMTPRQFQYSANDYPVRKIS